MSSVETIHYFIDIFRIGYISQLWHDTKDIEFVKQTIGHRSLNSISGYVSEMKDQERQNRISSI